MHLFLDGKFDFRVSICGWRSTDIDTDSMIYVRYRDKREWKREDSWRGKVTKKKELKWACERRLTCQLDLLDNLWAHAFCCGLYVLLFSHASTSLYPSLFILTSAFEKNNSTAVRNSALSAFNFCSLFHVFLSQYYFSFLCKNLPPSCLLTTFFRGVSFILRF